MSQCTLTHVSSAHPTPDPVHRKLLAYGGARFAVQHLCHLTLQSNPRSCTSQNSTTPSSSKLIFGRGDSAQKASSYYRPIKSADIWTAGISDCKQFPRGSNWGLWDLFLFEGLQSFTRRATPILSLCGYYAQARADVQRWRAANPARLTSPGTEHFFHLPKSCCPVPFLLHMKTSAALLVVSPQVQAQGGKAAVE
eukprot:2217939-Pleurochrysis_carterae.AAC.1